MDKKETKTPADSPFNSPEELKETDRNDAGEIDETALDEVSGGITPRDASTGQAVGRRMHKPIRIITPVGVEG